MGSDPCSGLLFTLSGCEPSCIKEFRKNAERAYAVDGHSNDRKKCLLSSLPHILIKGRGAAGEGIHFIEKA